MLSLLESAFELRDLCYKVPMSFFVVICIGITKLIKISLFRLKMCSCVANKSIYDFS